MVNIPHIKTSNKRKGLGYIIEAFASVLIILIFVMSHLIDSPDTRDWNEFQSQVSANDLTYVMKKTGHTQNLLKRGETGSIQTAFTEVTGGQMSVFGTIKDTPIGQSNIGFYTSENKIRTEALSQIDSNDRCRNRLEEIETEHKILRTDGALDQQTGVRLYLADTDPQYANNFDGKVNYDTFWVDNGTYCQFSSSEGPHLLDDYFKWGNNTYDLKEVDNSTGNWEVTVYQSNIARALEKEIEKSSNDISIEASFDSFNFSKEDLNYDLIIIHSRENLPAVNSHKERLMEFQKDSSLLLLMDLREQDLENGFLAETGLTWADLGRTNMENITTFTNSTNSEEVKEYLKSLGCELCEPRLETGGKILSNRGQYLTSGDKMLIGKSSAYETQNWDSFSSSMSATSNPPEGIPESTCGTTEAEFEFPTASGTEQLTVYNTRLSSGGSCSPIRGISIDLNDDGTIQSDETTFLQGDKIYINERLYSVVIPESSVSSGEEAGFVFEGDRAIEFVNHRESFPNQSIQKFARMNSIANGNNLEQEKVPVTSAVILWLLEKDREFGNPTSTDVSTTTIGGLKEDSYIPYKIYLRWYN